MAGANTLKQINSSSRFLFIYVFFLPALLFYFFLAFSPVVCVGACVKFYFPLPFSQPHFLWHCGFSHFFDLARLYLIFIIKRLPLKRKREGNAKQEEKQAGFFARVFPRPCWASFFFCGSCYLCCLPFDTLPYTRTHTLYSPGYGVEENKEKVPVNRSWFVFSMRMPSCLVWELQISGSPQSNWSNIIYRQGHSRKL